MILVLVIILFTLPVYSFIFNQQQSGYVLESIVSLPQQTKYQGLGYVNNALVDINSVSIVNPAVVFEVFYKEINFSYHPLVLGSNVFSTNFTSVLPFEQLYIPISISLFNLTSGSAERINMFKESYGYTFNESLNYINISISCYNRKLNTNFGINYKNVFQTIDTYNAYGTNIDFGILTPAKGKEYVWGISWLNILPVKFGNEKFTSTIRTSLNHAAGTIFFSEVTLYTELDFVNIYQPDKLSIFWGVGTTYDFFFLPISISFSFTYYGVNIGIDIEKENFNFSYGLGYNLTGPLHRFALNYKFNFYPKETINAIRQEMDKIQQQKHELLTEYKKQKEEIKELKKQLDLQNKIITKILYAKDMVAEKNYVKAKLLLEEVKQLDPQNIEVNELLSLVNSYLNKETVKLLYIEAKNLYDKGKYQDAIEKLNKLLELDPGNFQANLLIKFASVQKFIYEKNYIEAKSVLFDILKTDPDNKEAVDLLKKVETLLELEQ